MSSTLSNLTKIIMVFSSKAGKGIGGLVLSYVLARKFGAYGSGQFFIAYTFAFLCAQFSQLGLGNSCLKFAPVLRNEDPQNLSFLWTATQLIVGTFALLLTVTVMTGADFFAGLVFKDASQSQYIISAAPIILFWSLTYLMVFFRQSLGDVSGIALVENSLIPWGMVLLACLAFIVDFSVLQLLACVSVLFGCCFIFGVISTKRKFSLKVDLKLNSSVSLNDIMAYSLPLLVIAFAQNSLMWINTLILGGIGSVADSAVFVASMRVGASISILLYTFNSVYVPHISEAYARDDHEAIQSVYNDITASLSFFSFLFLLVALVYSDMIMSAFGSDFGTGTGCLVFLILGNVFNCYIGPVGYILIMAGRSALDAANTLIALAVNSVLCFLAYIWLGVAGAGMAFFASNLLLNMMRYFQCRKILSIKWSNGFQIRMVCMQICFAVSYLLLRNFEFNREVMVAMFCVVYLLVNVNTVRALLLKVKGRDGV